jgi:hypothetical protein
MSFSSSRRRVAASALGGAALLVVLLATFTAPAQADRPVIVSPVEGAVTDSSKVGFIVASAAPGQSVLLQICQVSSTTPPASISNRCGIWANVIGYGAITSMFMEESKSTPGKYLFATDQRCGLVGIISTRPVYLRAVVVARSLVSSSEFYMSGNGYFNTVAFGGGTRPLEDETSWGPQVGVSVTEPPLSFVKPVAGISVDDAATYTNSTKVRIEVQPPPCTAPYATSVVLSNDGGFKTSQTIPIEDVSPETGATVVDWTLKSSGQERLPKTVYANIGGARFTDDIILDQTAPVIEGAGIASSASTSRSAALRSYRVKVRASDKTSGVALAQVATDKAKKKLSVPQKYRASLTVKSAAKPLWVRVQDRAGNFSKWKALR